MRWPIALPYLLGLVLGCGDDGGERTAREVAPAAPAEAEAEVAVEPEGAAEPEDARPTEASATPAPLGRVRRPPLDPAERGARLTRALPEPSADVEAAFDLSAYGDAASSLAEALRPYLALERRAAAAEAAGDLDAALRHADALERREAEYDEGALLWLDSRAASVARFRHARLRLALGREPLAALGDLRYVLGLLAHHREGRGDYEPVLREAARLLLEGLPRTRSLSNEDASTYARATAAFVAEALDARSDDELARLADALPATLRAETERFRSERYHAVIEGRREALARLADVVTAREPLAMGVGCGEVTMFARSLDVGVNDDDVGEGTRDRGAFGCGWTLRVAPPTGMGGEEYPRRWFYFAREGTTYTLFDPIDPGTRFECSTGMIEVQTDVQRLDTTTHGVEGFYRTRRYGWDERQFYGNDEGAADLTTYLDLCDEPRARCTTLIIGQVRCRWDEESASHVCPHDWETQPRFGPDGLRLRNVRGNTPATLRGTLAYAELFAAPAIDPPPAQETPAGMECHPEVHDPRPPLNVRQRPDQTSPVVGRLGNGERVTIRGANGRWRRIDHPVEGWIYSRNLRRVCSPSP